MHLSKTEILRHPAVIRVTALLSSGDWVRTLTIKKMLAGSGIGLYTLGEILHIAESDRGRYVCIPGFETSELAPDELKAIEVQLYKLLEDAAA